MHGNGWFDFSGLPFFQVSKNVASAALRGKFGSMLVPHSGGNQGYQRVKLVSGMNLNLKSQTEQLPPLHSSGIQVCTHTLRQWAFAKQNTGTENGKAVYHSGLSMTSIWQTFSAVSVQNGFKQFFILTWRKANWRGLKGRKETKMQRSWMAQGLGCAEGTVWEKC